MRWEGGKAGMRTDCTSDILFDAHIDYSSWGGSAEVDHRAVFLSKSASEQRLMEAYSESCDFKI
jgi:hypothetical protein